jgi:phytoene dehydrogenase-like protein
VTIFEKNSRPGGRCDRFSRDGHHFDTGPTLMVMRLLYEAEFAALGASLQGMLELQRVDPTYHRGLDKESPVTWWLRFDGCLVTFLQKPVTVGGEVKRRSSSLHFNKGI